MIVVTPVPVVMSVLVGMLVRMVMVMPVLMRMLVRMVMVMPVLMRMLVRMVMVMPILVGMLVRVVMVMPVLVGMLVRVVVVMPVLVGMSMIMIVWVTISLWEFIVRLTHSASLQPDSRYHHIIESRGGPRRLLQKVMGIVSHQKLDYESILRRSGHRVTLQRVVILDAVCMGQGRSTLGQIASDVRRAAPDIALSTIYRTIKAFTDVGLITASRGQHGALVYDIAHEH